MLNWSKWFLEVSLFISATFSIGALVSTKAFTTDSTFNVNSNPLPLSPSSKGKDQDQSSEVVKPKAHEAVMKVGPTNWDSSMERLAERFGASFHRYRKLLISLAFIMAWVAYLRRTRSLVRK